MALLVLGIDAAAAATGRTVRPGGVVVAEVSGFDARATVIEHLVGSAGSTTVRANQHGMVHLTYHAPRAPGRYRLTLSGPPPASATRPSNAPAGDGNDQSTIVVLVPRVALIDFTVTKAAPGSGLGVGAGSRSDPPGPPAATGIDVEAPLVLAALLLVSGAGLVAAARRRRP
jgi:hypothetical protein